ncbi:hypothetical protein GN958_ATG20425 [Phytophthora infestans]|uniref:Uncharacterized protein n=1 Tax=Phytophthora infestans TaxID=4787 RepID=A0A8S9TSA1_PHYIN|nr:hypothetical protein GN958_ATG20425 [Phytophthora infestans]
MSTQECSNALASEETPPIAGLSERLVVIRGKEMDPVLWSEASGEDSQQSSSEATEAPPTKKARLASDQVNVRASHTSIPTKKKAVSKKKTAHKKTKKAAPKKSAPAKKTSAPKKSKTSAPPMRWTVALTALAIETRYKYPRVLKKSAVSTADTKMMRAKWEATVHTFQVNEMVSFLVVHAISSFIKISTQLCHSSVARGTVVCELAPC